MKAETPEVPPGLVVVDKPSGWTSHDVVARVRRLAGTRRVGHAGTLDPMATGVLVIGVGRATRLLTYLVGADKEYLATIRLGARTLTDDAEGEVLERQDASGVRAEALAAGVAALAGPIEQVPSAVSAIKVDGKRSYARVRAGEDVVLPPRPVTVHQFDVLGTRPDVADGLPVLDVDVLVGCTSGTYVRALARDLGADLGVGGHLTMLRRTRVGPYGLPSARSLEELEREFTILPVAAAARLAFPVRELTDAEATELRHGRRLAATGTFPAAAPADGSAGGSGPVVAPSPVAAFAPDGTLVALLGEADGVARPLLVLSAS